MPRSPYNTLMNRPPSSGKISPLRQSVPAPADGALSGEGSGGWGLNSMLRSSMHIVTPRPPSSEPIPPVASSSSGTAKSPMAFRARRFNHANSGSDSDLNSSLPFPAPLSSSFPDPNRRRSGSDNNRPVSPSSQALVATPIAAATLGRQISSTSSSSSMSIRPTTSPASNILATFNGHSVNASLDGTAAAATSPSTPSTPSGGSKTLRPKSCDTVTSNGGGSIASTTTTSSSSKVLRNRLSEDAAGGHAAGAPTLSLREKLAILQRNNRALEQQLAEAANENQQRAAQQHEAHVAVMAALQQRLATLESHLAAQQQSNVELTQRNKYLTEGQQQLTAQLAEANAAAAAAAKALAAARREATAAAVAGAASSLSSPPHPHKALCGTQLSEAGPASPRTPLAWDAMPAGSPGSCSSSSHDSTANGSAAVVTALLDSQSPLLSPPQRALHHGGGGAGAGSGSGSFRCITDDVVPPYPHIRLESQGSGEAVVASSSSSSSRPHTAPHAHYTPRSSSQSGFAATTQSPTGDGCLASESASLLLISHSEPDLIMQEGTTNATGKPEEGRRTTHPGVLGIACNDGGGGDIYLVGSGPPPASPVAAAAGLSGAGVALLARQKKLIVSLRQQLQQKDSAYAFLSNEHSELEGQLKEVEAAKREYAARYAFMVLDQDLDGHIRVDQVSSFDMFGCYSAAVLEYAFKHWRFASGFKGYLNMDDFVKFVTLSDDRSSRDSQRFWFMVLDLDGDGAVSAADAKWFYDSVEKDESSFVVGYEDLWNQVLDMTQPADNRRGFTSSELWRCKLGGGVIGLLLNHNNMLLHRTTSEWGRGDFPL